MRHRVRWWLMGILAGVLLGSGVGWGPGLLGAQGPAGSAHGAGDSPAGATQIAPPIVLGAHLEPDNNYQRVVQDFNQASGKRHEIVMYFEAWQVNAPENQVFNPFLLDQLVGIGVTPLVLWDPNNVRLADVAAGTYDNYLRAYARGVRNWGHPLLLSPAHEPNVTSTPWYTTPEIYKAAWQRIVNIFREQQATNVRWVWTSNWASSGPDVPPPHAFYPGDSYVDWVGVDGFNWGARFPGGGFAWAEAEAIFGPVLRDFACRFRKPQMIVEVGTVDDRALVASHTKTQWLRDAYTAFQRYPSLRAVVYFNQFAFNNPQNADFRLTEHPRYPGYPLDPSYVGAYREAIASSRFFSEMPAYESLVPGATVCGAQVYIPILRR